MNSALAEKFPQMRVGQTVTMRTADVERSWRVVGLTREAFSPAVGYVPLASVRGQEPVMVNSLRLALDRTDDDSIRGLFG